jgi:hypothetical protein
VLGYIQVCQLVSKGYLGFRGMGFRACYANLGHGEADEKAEREALVYVREGRI